MRCSRTEAPSLHRRYPASPVLRASPPPCSARPDPRGLSVGACHATGRASRVAAIPLFHACRRQYPGGNGRCSVARFRPLAAFPVWQAVDSRIAGFEAFSAFARATARVVAEPPRRPFVVGVLQPMSLPPSSAPTATGWSDSCRAGFAPAEEWRPFTAHYHGLLGYAASSKASSASPPPSGGPTGAPCTYARPRKPNPNNGPSSMRSASTRSRAASARPSSDRALPPVDARFVVPLAPFVGVNY